MVRSSRRRFVRGRQRACPGHGLAGRRRSVSRTVPASGERRRRRSTRTAGRRRYLRRELVGNLVTYVVNRNINFTNVCFVGCKFCAFSRGPREADTYFHSLETMAQKASEAWEMGATEVCIQGGLPHGLPPFYYRDILRAVKKAVPGMHIHAFSPMEIVYGVELTGMPLADYLQMLRDNGLDTLPGTAAEILDDEVRLVLSRNKLSTAAVEGSDSHRASMRHSHHLHPDVRTRRNSRLIGSINFCCCAKFRSRLAASPNSCRWVSCIKTRCSFIKDLRAPAQLWPSISKFTLWRASCWPAPSTTSRFRG